MECLKTEIIESYKPFYVYHCTNIFWKNLDHSSLVFDMVEAVHVDVLCKATHRVHAVFFS